MHFSDHNSTFNGFYSLDNGEKPKQYCDFILQHRDYFCEESEDNGCFEPTWSIGSGGEPLVPLQPTYLNPPLEEQTNAETDNYINEEWKRKRVKDWNTDDILEWLNHQATVQGIWCTDIRVEPFTNMGGANLAKAPKQKFMKMDKKYGAQLYENLQEFMSTMSDTEISLTELTLRSNAHLPTDSSENISMDNNNIESSDHVLTSLDNTIKKTDFSAPKPTQEMRKKKIATKEAPSAVTQKIKQKSSRNKTKKIGRLWEFLRDLLKDERYCPSHILWDNYEEGMFRFVHSAKVAKLWGDRKENPVMNYEKLSRAMRYYYKSKVLQPVIGRRLVYKFGPKATGWRVDNPNFLKNKPTGQ